MNVDEPDNKQHFEIAHILADWTAAEAGLAARLASLAGRLGALNERLQRRDGRRDGRGAEGARHRLALIEAAELSWWSGDRIAPDRLALWVALRLSGVQEDSGALARAGWAVRRLSGGAGAGSGRGPGPETDLAGFLGRHDPAGRTPDADRFEARAAQWQALIQAGKALHPISRACMGYHLWARAGLGLGPETGRAGAGMEAAVSAARLAAGAGTRAGNGAVVAPLALAGTMALRPGGPVDRRLARWLEGMDRAALRALRHLDELDLWSARAAERMASRSGRTPPALREVLTDWPLVSAPMAARLTGASRAAVLRNLNWMEAQGLIREVTGQGRFRMWRIAR